MKRITILSFVSLILLFQTIVIVGCQTSNTYVIHEEINERPETELINFDDMKRFDNVYVIFEEESKIIDENFTELPSLNKGYNPFQIDLRSQDLQHFDLGNYEDELDASIFDTNTVWPREIPVDFDPSLILELGKEPGLGIRELHRNGITGKGVNVAIFDTALYARHESYSENIKTYEMINCLDDSSHMHGSLVTSLFVGDSTGVAPDAEVHYIAMTFGDFLETGPEKNLNYLVQGIDRVLEVNSHLSTDEQIKVISISTGIDKGTKGYNNFLSAVDRASNEGVFVLTCTPETNFDLRLGGLARDSMSDPNTVESYELGSLPSLTFRNKNDIDYTSFLLVPMDNRTSANCTGDEDYQYFNVGGNSNIVPWIAGLYALCLQVDSELNIDDFIDLAYETAYDVELNNSYYEKINTKIINPKKLISYLIENKN